MKPQLAQQKKIQPKPYKTNNSMMNTKSQKALIKKQNIKQNRKKKHNHKTQKKFP